MSKDVQQPIAAIADDFAAWAAEAKAKAKANVGAVLAHGSVVDPDPRLHYAVLDGDAPKPTLERHRAYHDALGFRVQDGVQVIGYRNPVVMAIPVEVYRDTIRAQRVADTAKSMGKWGGMSMMVDAPVKYS
jgi:hypothetical protein